MTDKRPADPIFTLTCGAVEAYPAVLRATARPILYDYDPAFLAYYEMVTEKARRAMRLETAPVIMQGAPVLALEAAAASLIAPGDKALNLVSGVYGKGFGVWSRHYAGEAIEIVVPFNESIDPDRVAAAFRKHPTIRVVSVCHHETPSGTINPLAEIGRIVKEHDAYLIVDAVSSFGGMDIHAADCDADIFVGAVQKCLGGVPGLALVGVSDRAWRKMKANERAPRHSYLSLLDWEHAWRRDQRFPTTLSISLVYGLDAALDLYLEEGPEAVWARHALTGRACREGAKAMGLDLWPASEAIASPMSTAIRVPDGISEPALRLGIRERHRVMLAPGAGDTMGKLIRIAHMGPTAHPLYAVLGLVALGSGLKALNHPVSIEAGVAAAMTVIDAAP